MSDIDYDTESNTETREMIFFKNDFKYRKYSHSQYKEYNKYAKFKDYYDKYEECASEYDDMDNLKFRILECKESKEESLDLSHLELNGLPLDLPKNIKYLFCAENNFNNFNKTVDFAPFYQLVVIDLNNCNLSKLPTLPKTVEEIVCRYNKIDDISDIVRYPNLKRFDCSYNQIEIVPPHGGLEILNCNYNKIVNIGEISKLKKLFCAHNRLDGLNQMNNLEILDCNHNNITSILNFPNLKNLMCEKNIIEIVNNLPNLQQLHCYDNSITTIEYFKNLEELICDYKVENIDKSYKEKIESAIQYKDGYILMLFNV